MRESEVEAKVCKHAKSQGWLVYKFSSPSNKGVPDRVWIKKGVVIFIEFKAPSKKPSKIQSKVISRIRGEGVPVYIIDNIKEGKELATIKYKL